jgi:Fe-S cluster biogenesis protein NfuA
MRSKNNAGRRVNMTKEQVEDVLAKVRPMLQRDGGDVSV